MKTLEEILIARNELDRLYLGNTTLHLWRAVRIDNEQSGGVLHPELQEREMSRGKIRPADVDTYNQQGQLWVRSKIGKGVSLLDRPNAFPGTNWEYFIIPVGTEIPAGLVIIRDHFIKRYNATHYSISPNCDMLAQHYLTLLDSLAEYALRQLKDVSNG